MVSHECTLTSDTRRVVSDPATREVLDAIRRIVRALREASRATERSLGLSAAQVFVLQPAVRRVAAVGQRAGRADADASELRLGRRQQAARPRAGRAPPSAADARRVEIPLTAQGRALLDRAPAVPPQDRLIAGLVLIGAQRRRRLASGAAPAGRRDGAARASRRRCSSRARRAPDGAAAAQAGGEPPSVRRACQCQTRAAAGPPGRRLHHHPPGDPHLPAGAGRRRASAFVALALLRADRPVHQPLLLPALVAGGGLAGRPHAGRHRRCWCRSSAA